MTLNGALSPVSVTTVCDCQRHSVSLTQWNRAEEIQIAATGDREAAGSNPTGAVSSLVQICFFLLSIAVRTPHAECYALAGRRRSTGARKCGLLKPPPPTPIAVLTPGAILPLNELTVVHDTASADRRQRVPNTYYSLTEGIHSAVEAGTFVMNLRLMPLCSLSFFHHKNLLCSAYNCLKVSFG